MIIKTKDFTASKIKASEDKPGAIEGYLSVFGVRDSYNEVVLPGAFANSLARHKREGTYPLLLWQHDTYEPIGVWDDLADDGKGLYGKGRLLIEQNVPIADKAYSLLKAEALWGQSIGYREIDVEPAKDGEARKLIELDLMEGSIVSFPANRRAMVEGIKGDINSRLETFARNLRDGEPMPIKEFEDILRDAGVPRSMAVQIASVGYAKAIRSESEGGEATVAAVKDAIASLRAAVPAKS